MAKPAIKMIESNRGKAICEDTKRFDILFRGKVFDRLYWNMRGYCGYLPCPDGGKLDIGEKSLAEYRRAIADLNREFAAADARLEAVTS
jgi:hypothetical protein